MTTLRFQTADLAIVRRKLAAARELFGDETRYEICLGISAWPCLVTTKGDDIWTRGTPEPVLSVGRKLVHLSSSQKDIIDPTKQTVPTWTIEIRQLEGISPVAEARAGDALKTVAARLAQEPEAIS